MNPLQRWMAKANAAQKRQLAALAKTTVGSLRQIAGAYRTEGNKTRTTPELARRIENATVQMSNAAKLKGLRMPIVMRTDLCPACASCDYAKKCKG